MHFILDKTFIPRKKTCLFVLILCIFLFAFSFLTSFWLKFYVSHDRLRLQEITRTTKASSKVKSSFYSTYWSGLPVLVRWWIGTYREKLFACVA